MKTDHAFIRDLDRSRQAVNAFAAKAREAGWDVWLPPESVRPDSAVRLSYSDSGDMAVMLRVEHKKRWNIRWTSRDDYPFDTVYIDEVYKDGHDRSNPLGWYVIEDATGEHLAIVQWTTRSDWTIAENVWDAHQNRYCRMYQIDKSRVWFVPASEFFERIRQASR